MRAPGRAAPPARPRARREAGGGARGTPRVAGGVERAEIHAGRHYVADPAPSLAPRRRAGRRGGVQGAVGLRLLDGGGGRVGEGGGGGEGGVGTARPRETHTRAAGGAYMHGAPQRVTAGARARAWPRSRTASSLRTGRGPRARRPIVPEEARGTPLNAPAQEAERRGRRPNEVAELGMRRAEEAPHER